MSRHPLPRGAPPPLIPHSTSLVDFILSDPSPSDLANGLSEFAWRCLNDGISVRVYCGEISKVIARVGPIPAEKCTEASCLWTCLRG